MTWIKTAAIVLLGLFLVLVVAGVMRPPVWSAEVSQDIAAPSTFIHRHIADFRKWPDWSGWDKAGDPQAEFTYSGPETGVGATWAWKGPEMGFGRLVVTGEDPAKGLWLDEAIESDELNAKGSLTYEDLGSNRTRVTWKDDGRLPALVGGLVGGFVSDRLRQHFAAGLSRLKVLAEADFAKRQRLPETKVFGSVHGVMMARDWSAKVKLAEVAGDGAIGVGALAGLQGEVTFLDGKAWVARVIEGKVVDSVSREPEGQAALLVVAKVPRWRASIVSSAFDHSEIGKRVAARVSHLGLPTDKPIPFRLRAAVVDAAWHVMDGSRISDDAHGHEAHMQAGHVQKRALVKADIVGFYTPNHAGIITHHGIDVHAHIILPKEGISGHLDSGVIQAKAILMLPDPSP